MKQDLLLLLGVTIVWAVLAAVYAWAPGLGMPGYARVWGVGAVIFLALAVTMLVATRPRV